MELKLAGQVKFAFFIHEVRMCLSPLNALDFHQRLKDWIVNYRYAHNSCNHK